MGKLYHQTFGHLVFTIVALTMPWFASKGSAETMRPLQTGPVGDGAVFAVGPSNSMEGDLLLRNSQGLARVQTSGDRILSDAQQSGLAFGTIHPLSDTFWFHSTVEIASLDYHAVSRGGRGINERVAQSTFQGSAGPILRKGALLLDGEVFLKFQGEEYRKVETEVGNRRYTGKATTIPALHGVVGLDLGTLFVAAGLQTFNQSKVDGTVTAESGKVTSLQVAERLPGRFTFDARLRQSPEFEWALSTAFVASENGSLDPEKALVTRTTASLPPSEVEGRLEQDHVEVGGACVYHVDALSSFLGTLKYIQESYRKPEYVSLERENAGGVELGIGSQFGTSFGNASFAASYLMSERRSYTQGDLKLIELGNSGDKIDTELAAWSLVIGLTRVM